MAETKGQTKDIQRGYFAFVFYSFKNHAIESYSRKKERVIYFMEKIYEFLCPVIVFLFSFLRDFFLAVKHGIHGIHYEFLCPVIVFLFSFLRGFFLAITHGIQSLIAMVRSILYFDYKQFLLSVKARVRDYSIQAKTKTYKILWVPIRKRMFRLRKQARKQLLDMLYARIYFRGFFELCRRLFLLVSDYTPGGQWTVAFCLLLSTIFIGFEMVRYSRLVFKVLDFALSSIMFLLRPVAWTLQDVWIVIAFVLNIILSLVQYVWLLFIAFLQGIGNFVLRVLTAFLSVIYRILSWIFELRCVQYAWPVFLELTLITMEVFIFKVLPVVMKIVSHLITVSTIASRYFYEYFVAVYVGEEKEHEYFTHTRICGAIFTIICLILAYRYRKRFPSDLCQEIEDEGSTAGTRSRTRRLKTARYFDTGRKDADTTGHEDEVHFQLSSSAHICIGFLRGQCKKGRRCEGHHCPWPYHWQYRVPVQGWKSFSPADSDIIEQLFSEPTNEITKTMDIDPDLSALTRRSHVKSDTPVRLDFQQMRMEVDYYRSELRRLSTESYVKNPSDVLTTRWVWYQLSDQGEWNEYGNEKSSIPKQEAIEASFIRRESSYNYKREGQDYRIYYFMTPMYERSMNPRAYKRRLVRRRPEYQPLDTGS